MWGVKSGATPETVLGLVTCAGCIVVSDRRLVSILSMSVEAVDALVPGVWDLKPDEFLGSDVWLQEVKFILYPVLLGPVQTWIACACHNVSFASQTRSCTPWQTGCNCCWTSPRDCHTTSCGPSKFTIASLSESERYMLVICPLLVFWVRLRSAASPSASVHISISVSLSSVFACFSTTPSSAKSVASSLLASSLLTSPLSCCASCYLTLASLSSPAPPCCPSSNSGTLSVGTSIFPTLLPFFFVTSSVF